MKKKPSLSKDKIISKAIIIADRGGIEALSMRILAGELNIQAMSLYYHFKSKDELIAQMADKLITQIDFGDSDENLTADWLSVMLNRAQSAKDLFREHTWLPFVIDTQIRSGVKRLEYLNKFIGTLRKAGFPIELALRAASLIDSYVYGFCRKSAYASDNDKSPEELAESFSTGFNAAEYPYLSEATLLVMEQGYDENADFLYGLNVILKGIGLELETLASLSEAIDKSK